MKYFEVIQDSRMPCQYKIERIVWQESEHEKFGMLYFSGEEQALSDFVIYENDFFVSLDLKQVIAMYTDAIVFDLVVFNNLELKIQKEYYCLRPCMVDALGPSTTYLKNNWVDKKVFSREKIGFFQVFVLTPDKARGITSNQLYMHLDLVESVLRRGLWGMIFNEILLEG